MSWCHIFFIRSIILYICSGCVTASEYYVSAAPNGVDCPHTDLRILCYNLSYLADDYLSYFTDDTTFHFLNGTHTLESTLVISDVSNITLQGLGSIKQGFHETVMQSTSVIMCSDYKNSGIEFANSTDIVLKSLTIANCGFNTFISSQIHSRNANVSLFFVHINNVTMEWVSIQNGSGYGLCLVNSFDASIVNSTFANNGGPKTTGGNALIVTDSQSKGLFNVNIVKSNFTLSLVAGMNLWYYSEVKVIIKNCRFSHNVVGYGGGVYIQSQGNGSIEFHNSTLSNNIARYRGGGVYMNLFKGSGSIKFDNCTIYNNSAHNYGGGVDIHLQVGGGSIEFSDCTICSNIVGYNGGGVHIDLHGGDSIEFDNCTIYNNTADYDGGGVYIDSYEVGGNIEFSNCTISTNTAYLGSGLFLRAIEVALRNRFYLKNVLFCYNKAGTKLAVYQKIYQSAVALFNIGNILFVHIEVSKNNITGLVCFNSRLTFDRQSTFENNLGIYGGGIALYDSSQLLLKEYAKITFVNNQATKSGGGIFVSQVLDVEKSTDCSFEVIYDRSCYNSCAELYFVNNTANISGDVLYGGNVNNNCFNKTDFETLFNYFQQEGNSVVSSEPIEVCFCESEKQNCSIINITMTEIPGINVSVSLAIVGLKDGLTEGVIKLTSTDSSYTERTRLNAKCTNVTFKTNLSLNTAKVYVKLESSISEPSLTKVIDVITQSCPVGFTLGKEACVCRPELNISSINCNINTQNITRVGDMWIGYKNDSDCLIVHQNCPFDYCNDGTVQFKVNYPDQQCLHERSGILCGQCKKGFSLLLGSNQCGECTNDHIALVIPFAVAGIALIAFIIVLNLTVSVGTVNGLIFYANVVKIYEPIFFSGGPIPILSQFISWINLDLGIETCFFDGMDSCSKAWLQFIFPIYIWFILMLIIILSRYSNKVVRLVGRQVIPVLATMILLSYTKLIRTVFHVIHRARINCNNDIWYVDANVQYAGGCHLPLFIFSLFVLIFLIVPYTFFLFTIPLFEGPLSKYMCCCQKLSAYMKPFFDAYGGPYKDKCRFWTGLLLLIRVTLALVVSLDTEATTSLTVLTSLLIVINFMYFLLKGVYQQFPLVLLEVIFNLNLILMAHMNLQNFEKSKQQVSNTFLLSISFVLFCGIIIYHVWDRLLKSQLQQLIQKVEKIFKKSPSTSNDIELPSTISAKMLPESADIERKPTLTSISMDISELMDIKRESILFID